MHRIRKLFSKNKRADQSQFRFAYYLACTTRTRNVNEISFRIGDLLHRLIPLNLGWCWLSKAKPAHHTKMHPNSIGNSLYLSTVSFLIVNRYSNNPSIIVLRSWTHTYTQTLFRFQIYQKNIKRFFSTKNNFSSFTPTHPITVPIPVPASDMSLRSNVAVGISHNSQETLFSVHRMRKLLPKN